MTDDKKKSLAAYKADWRLRNIERIKAERKFRYASNRDESIRKAAEWSAAHPEKTGAAKAAWKRRNPEYLRRDAAKRRAANPEKAREWTRLWSKANPAYFRAKNMKRHAAKLRAVPSWAEHDKIATVYQKAKQFGFEVDHVVPLQHKLVCGLHVWNNLQLLSKVENIRKKNYHWPDMP